MKVLLVSTNTVRVPYPVAPLGLALLAARLEGEFDVRLYDGLADGGAGLADLLRDFAPDVVAAGIRNVDDLGQEGGDWYPEHILRDFVAPIRAATRAPLVLGGSGFSLFPAAMLDFLGADYGIAGEAEASLPQLLRALETGQPVDAIPGIVYRDAGGVRVVPARTRPGALSHVFPRIDTRIDWTPYRGLGSYPIQTKRGCAHRCLYCTYPAVEGRAFRLRSPVEVADEIQETAARLPGTTFEFVDSTFNDPPRHAEAICREIASRNLGVRLRTMGINPGGISEDLFVHMKAAGFAQIDCTPDSASPRVIAALEKNFGRADLERGARIIREHRMPTVWFFLFGGPDEDEDTVRESLEFVDHHVAPDDLVLMGAGLRVYPDTGLHRRALAEGLAAPGDPLFRPLYYVSPRIGDARLRQMLRDAAATRPNCLPPGESTPDREMMGEAIRRRREQGLAEPMFRTLLRIRRERMGFPPVD